MLDIVFDCLTAWLAPILCFTAEEAWQARRGEAANGDDSQAPEAAEASVHLRLFPDIPETWRDDELAARWARVREVRRAVTGALEVERAEKRLRSSLQAHPRVYIDAPELRAALDGVDMAEIAITSDLAFVAGPPPAAAFRLDDVPGVAVVAESAQGSKCERCWRLLPEVGQVAASPDLCERCADAVHGLAVPAQ